LGSAAWSASRSLFSYRDHKSFVNYSDSQMKYQLFFAVALVAAAYGQTTQANPQTTWFKWFISSSGSSGLLTGTTAAAAPVATTAAPSAPTTIAALTAAGTNNAQSRRAILDELARRAAAASAGPCDPAFGQPTQHVSYPAGACIPLASLLTLPANAPHLWAFVTLTTLSVFSDAACTAQLASALLNNNVCHPLVLPAPFNTTTIGFITYPSAPTGTTGTTAAAPGGTTASVPTTTGLTSAATLVAPTGLLFALAAILLLARLF